MATKYSVVDIVEKKSSASVAQIVFRFFVLSLLVLLLINYKGAAGLNQIRRTQATGTLHLANLKIGAHAGDDMTAFSNALAYLKIVWPALVFGVLINCVGFVPFGLLQGLGRPDLTAKFHLLELPFYALALWFLSSRLGLPGAGAVDHEVRPQPGIQDRPRKRGKDEQQ